MVVAEKVRGPELPQCIYRMSERINHQKDFRAALAHHPSPYPSSAIITTWGKRRFTSYSVVENISIPPKKRRPRRSQHIGSNQRSLRRSPQQRRVRRPRPPPPLKQQFVRTHKFTVLFRTTNSSQRKYELKS